MSLTVVPATDLKRGFILHAPYEYQAELLLGDKKINIGVRSQQEIKEFVCYVNNCVRVSDNKKIESYTITVKHSYVFLREVSACEFMIDKNTWSQRSLTLYQETFIKGENTK